jgi:hypothetical protein
MVLLKQSVSKQSVSKQSLSKQSVSKQSVSKQSVSKQSFQNDPNKTILSKQPFKMIISLCNLVLKNRE